MEITIIDRIILLLTGVVALYLVYSFYNEYNTDKTEKRYNLWYIAAFAVLFIAGLLTALFGFNVLAFAFIKIVATIIPFGIVLGLVREYYPKYYRYYLVFLIIGFILISLATTGILQTRTVYPVFHAIAGLTIFFLPFLATRAKLAPAKFIWVGVGGALIGIGGLALASLGFGQPLLGIFTSELVFTILAPILLLMSISFAMGFDKGLKINKIRFI
ncbi:MAG TPA: hypothetical protein ENN90_09500 [Mariniphaga anaerophila]|uniref:Uncharacterized protein n=1 Tax=Mariniphaga anaerophila TaxID=1484053 RepID=A0A831PM21_9BACT|nr:hypothetical protein [Mariniphaga anaerophila]